MKLFSILFLSFFRAMSCYAYSSGVGGRLVFGNLDISYSSKFILHKLLFCLTKTFLFNKILNSLKYIPTQLKENLCYQPSFFLCKVVFLFLLGFFGGQTKKCLGVIPGSASRSYSSGSACWMPGMESRLAVCKAKTLPTELSLGPQFYVLKKYDYKDNAIVIEAESQQCHFSL